MRSIVAVVLLLGVARATEAQGAERSERIDADSARSTTLSSGTATLAGTVSGPEGKPVAGAEVRVHGSSGVDRTNERGEYVVAKLPSGTYEVEVRQIGFGMVRSSVDLRAGQRTRYDVTLARAAALDSVKVVDRRSMYPEFEKHRKEAMEGRFLDEGEIERMHVLFTSDVARTVPAFRVIGAGPDAKVVSSRGSCLPKIYVDLLPATYINEVPAARVGAMEFYPSFISAPMGKRSPCGTIMIWTKKEE